jgi:hypothetical protein
MALCWYCQNLNFVKSERERDPEDEFSSTFLYSTFALHQPSKKALQKSAKNGCALCSKFWAVLYPAKFNGVSQVDPFRGSTGREDLDKICDAEVPPVVLYCRHKEHDHNWLLQGSMKIRCGRIEHLYHPLYRDPVPGQYISLSWSTC